MIAIENLDASIVYKNSFLNEQIQKENPSKWNCVKVSLGCLRAEIVRSAYDTAAITSYLWRFIRTRERGVNNLRELGLAVSEHGRNMAGIVASPFMDSKKAADTFLSQGPNTSPQTPETEKEIGYLYAVASAIDHVFTNLSYPFSACSGTLLGIERSKSFIKGDDDVDLIFDEKLTPQMNFLFDEGIFQQMTGIKVHNQKKYTNGWQCYHEKAKKSEGKNDVPAGYFVDVMPVREQNGNYVFTHDEMRNTFASDYMTKEEFTNIVKKPFGPTQLNAPKDAQEYIARAYRRQAMTLSYSFVSHQTMGAFLANPTSPRCAWNFITGIFESRRRRAVTEPTSYNEEVYQQSRAEIFERIRLFQEELKVNKELSAKFQANTIPFRVFVDGVYDLFHKGHGRSFEKAHTIAEQMAFGRKIELIVGVCSDDQCESYKRRPIMTEQERENAVANHHLKPRVIHHSPTDGPTAEFLKSENINLVLHGDDFSEADRDKYYGHAVKLGIFKTYPYELGVSTTALLKSVQESGMFPEEFIQNHLTKMDLQVLIDRINARKKT